MNQIEELDELSFIKKLATCGTKSTSITSLFELLNTQYVFAITILKEESNITWRKVEGEMGVNISPIPFNIVFESVPTEVQEDLAFHFDIFKE